MKITVIGAGYVGLVASTCFADFGMQVTCLDNNVDKVNSLNKGIIPIFEPGLEELVIKNVKSGNLRFSIDKSELNMGEVVIIAVGTPSDQEGKTNLSYLDAVVEDIASYITNDKCIVIKSTVPIGTATRVRESLKNKAPNLNFHIISNPEFLREGSAVKDFLEPDRIVIGYHDEIGREIAQKLYAPLIMKNTLIVFTDNTTAEITKYTANAYLAMRVAFINEISDITEKFCGNIEDIAKGIGLDKRIGSHFLQPGPGYGGSCFPKDTLALSHIAHSKGVDSFIVDAVIYSNVKRKSRMADKIIEALGGEITNKTIAILGLTFKAETDDMRDSASIDIINKLIELKAKVRVYDPKGMEEAKLIFADKVEYCANPYHAATHAEIVVIITEWKEFKVLDLAKLKSIMIGRRIIDLRNIFSIEEMKKSGFEYISLGRPKINSQLKHA